jgi:hypothetical protein
MWDDWERAEARRNARSQPPTPSTADRNEAAGGLEWLLQWYQTHNIPSISSEHQQKINRYVEILGGSRPRDLIARRWPHLAAVYEQIGGR